MGQSIRVGPPAPGSGPIGALPALALGQGRGSATAPEAGLVSYWVVLRGRVLARWKGGSVELSRGHTALMLPGCVDPSLSSIGDASWIGLVDYSEAGSELEQLDLPRVDSLHIELERQLELACGERGQALNNVPVIMELLGTALTADKDSMLREVDACPGRTLRARRYAYSRLLRARNRLIVEPASVDSLESLAETSSYSLCHFIRTFHRAFGMPPMDLARNARLALAKDLLTTSSLAVCEIAQLSGFSNVGSFCRSFKRVFGSTAMEMRKAA